MSKIRVPYPEAPSGCSSRFPYENIASVYSKLCNSCTIAVFAACLLFWSDGCAGCAQPMSMVMVPSQLSCAALLFWVVA